MTSMHLGVEMKCDYGIVLKKVMIRMLEYWHQPPRGRYHFNLQLREILKHHPDVLGAFCYIIVGTLYAPTGLTFGSDFSPSTWEPPRRIIEQLAMNLFADKSLVVKHRKYLDQFQWGKKLRNAKPDEIVPALPGAMHKGVLDESGNDVNTPHNMFVDDGIMMDVYKKKRLEQAIAAGIEALELRQDYVSWDKLFEMMIYYRSILLGFLIDTRRMTIQVHPEYLAKVVRLLETRWHKKRKTFELKDIENLTGVLQHIATITPWLRHLLSHLFTSISAALKSNTSFFICTNKQFRDKIKKT
ncbi:hypothetical protein ACHAWF_002722 [Thalassiosira exigua]